MKKLTQALAAVALALLILILLPDAIRSYREIQGIRAQTEPETPLTLPISLPTPRPGVTRFSDVTIINLDDAAPAGTLMPTPTPTATPDPFIEPWKGESFDDIEWEIEE
jgi:hypothetical protein